MPQRSFNAPQNRMQHCTAFFVALISLSYTHMKVTYTRHINFLSWGLCYKAIAIVLSVHSEEVVNSGFPCVFTSALKTHSWPVYKRRADHSIRQIQIQAKSNIQLPNAERTTGKKEGKKRIADSMCKWISLISHLIVRIWIGLSCNSIKLICCVDVFL